MGNQVMSEMAAEAESRKDPEEGYKVGDNIMIIDDQELIPRMEKRVRQIANEICGIEYVISLPTMTTVELSCALKNIAIKYNCYIQSWVTINDACSKCYNAETRDDEDDNTYALIAAPDEPSAIIVAFLWLSDRHNFTPQAKKLIIEKGMNS